jgi:hypothetical protein
MNTSSKLWRNGSGFPTGMNTPSEMWKLWNFNKNQRVVEERHSDELQRWALRKEVEEEEREEREEIDR